MQLKITDAGRAALVNPPNTGTSAVTVTQIGLTASAFTPSAAMTALPGEFKRVATIAGMTVGDDIIHVTIRDESADSYTLRGFGLYLSNGTLFAVSGQADPIMEKASASVLLLAADTKFVGVDTAQVQFGSTDFSNPPATTEVQGVVELATNTEAEDGADAQRAVTPRGLRAFIDKRFGPAAPTAFVKNLLSAATDAAFRAGLGLKSAALKDTGHGNGLDADTLDGKHASEFSPAGDYAPAAHSHPYLPLTGGQVNGAVTLRGFAGAPNWGVLYLGSDGSFMEYKAGAVRFWNEGAGSETTLIGGGGTTWTSGNFNPDTKLSRSGGEMSGNLLMRGNSKNLKFYDDNNDVACLDIGAGYSSGVDRNGFIANRNPAGFVEVFAANGAHRLRVGPSGLQYNEGSVWHGGNFNPELKASLGGATFTGAVTVKNQALRSAGWGGHSNDGVVYFGEGDSYIYKAGSRFTFRNVEGNLLANLQSSGAIWTSGNFDPVSKVSKTGDTISGSLFIDSGGLFVQPTVGGTRVRIVSDGQGTAVQAVSSDQTQFSTLSLRGSSIYAIGAATFASGLNVAGDLSTDVLNVGNGQQFWNVDGAGNGWGCNEYVNNYGGGTGGHWFYVRPDKTAALTRVMGVGRNGALWVSGGYDFGSSRKLKDISGTMPYGLAEVERMELAIGRYKKDYNSDSRSRLFFVAEQLAELVPEAVDPEAIVYNGERVASVKIEQMLPVLASAIKELSAIVRAQGETLAALKEGR